MRFIVRAGNLPAFALKLKTTDVVHLQPDNWDDYGFVTGFNATLYPQSNAEKAIEIGFVKILKKSQKPGTRSQAKTLDLLSSDNLLEFEELPQEYYSLGQNEEFYQALAEQGEEFYNKYLVAMNDVYGNPEIGHKFEEEDGFTTSLLRSSAAAALYVPLSKSPADTLFEPATKEPHFKASINLPGATRSHNITFSFEKNGDLPNRIFVLVGKNGVGKTQILARLAFLISGGGQSISIEKEVSYKRDEITSRGFFKNVMAFSFSAFDDFEIPSEAEDSRTSYRYWGLRGNKNKLLTTDQLTARIYATVRNLSPDRKEIFEKYLQHIAPRLNLSDVTGRSAKKTIKEQTSAGQKMMLATLAGLVSFLKDRSILLFDEPVTHLHPSMLANLMSVINGLLDEFNSYAIISTHSPIVLQQVPSKYVKVIRRIESTPDIGDLSIETFGENFTEISQEVFDVSDYERDYKDIFIDLLKEHSSQEILNMFNNRLGISARALLHSLEKEVP